VALPSSVAMSPNATMALPSEAFNPPSPAAPGARGALPPSPVFGAQPIAPGVNGQGFGGFPQGGPAPSFGQQANPALTPAGMVGGVPMHLPISGPGGPQSQIETALSLPRPDPAALLAAQQDRERGERRNLGVLIAVVALTVLCVVGICAIVYLKLRARTHAGAPPDTAAAVVASASPSSTGAAPDTAPTASAVAATPAATAVGSAAAPPTPTSIPQPGGSGKVGAGKSKDEPGFLTIVCSPGCDDVADQGRSLGPPPIVHLAAAPGAHRITGRRGKDSRTISVVVVSGQVTTGSVSMK
jgi:hypothetical protein